MLNGIPIPPGIPIPLTTQSPRQRGGDAPQGQRGRPRASPPAVKVGAGGLTRRSPQSGGESCSEDSWGERRRRATVFRGVTRLIKDRTRGFEAPGRPRRQDGASEKPRPVAITSGIPTRFPTLGGPQRRGDAQAVRSRFNQKASRRTNNGWRPAKRESPSVAYGVSCRVRHEEVCRKACASFTPLSSDCQRQTGWLVVGRRVWVPRSPQMSVCGDSALIFNCVPIVARRGLAVTSRYGVQPSASSSLRKSLIRS